MKSLVAFPSSTVACVVVVAAVVWSPRAVAAPAPAPELASILAPVLPAAADDATPSSAPAVVRRVGVSASSAEPTATAVVAAPNAGKLNADDLALALTERLVVKFAPAGDLQLELVNPWTPLALPGANAADWQVVVTEFPAAGLEPTFLVRFQVKAGKGGDETTLGEWRLPVRAQLWQETWVASRRLVRGELLNGADLERQKVDVLREKTRTPLSAAVAPEDLELVQTVAAGQPLGQRDVRRRPSVRRGQVVEVTAADALLSVSMKALAVQDGADGETVRVRNVTSNKEFEARVVGANRVQVRF